MPFFIPAAAVGAGVGLIVWGSRMILSDDDSADDIAAEILSCIPEKFEEYIDHISVTPSGIQITFQPGTPKKVKRAIRNNIDLDF